MQKNNEQEKISAIIKGDSQAFKEICAIYYDTLYRFIWRKTGDENISKDLTQELFLNIWKLRKQLDSTKSFKSYLYSAANNLTINHFKSMALKNKYYSAAETESLINVPIEQEGFSEYIEDTLRGLPEEQKTVFILNKFEGFKYSEIANILNVSVKTVEKRMGKILKTLREKFGRL
jgi:RNA polymerase sigma-70 factor (ECF subfamily)